MPSVNEFLRVAAAELGTTENPPDSNRVKYSTWYGLIGPWYAMYVDWCWVRAGGQDLRQLLTPDWAYTPAGVNAFRRKGWWYPSSAAQPGDVIFDSSQTGVDYLDCSRQTLSRISFQLRDNFGRILDARGIHWSFPLVFARIQNGI
jgi:hypothetical protein